MEYPNAQSAHPARRLGRYFLVATAVHLLLFVAVPVSWFHQGTQRSLPLLLKMEVDRPGAPPGPVAAPPDSVSLEQAIARAVDEAAQGAVDPAGSFWLHSQRGAPRPNLSPALEPAPGEVLETFTGPQGPRAVLRRPSGETLCFMATPVHDGSAERVLLWIRVRC